ncbi:secretory phospholipase A2 receptor-like [Poeciliopsis prolifica]|uniref:secretory phospholipase A2 receptor-like n=1 Tax=Poeciliopsis prolifica TaxID=188132 RepID=UPI002413D8A3|nr:secretory phospholipase A2 receptor-like [Poeciliopsis prolifica]
MKHSLCDPLILLLILGSSGDADGLGSVLHISYKHLRYPLTWENAQSFCRREFTDLATFYSLSDVNAAYFKSYNSWIGLHKDTSWLFGTKWIWSDGQTHKVNWQDNVENAEGNCASVAYKDKKIYVRDCGNRLFFTCQTSDKNYVFILEAKTWPEALDYCRSNYRDLVSFSSDDYDDVFFDREIPTWIGLHRDGASWKWSWGDTEYTNWLGELSASNDCGSISSLTKTTAPQGCGTPLPSLCIADNLVLMKEKRSWQEALELCRGLQSSSDLRYDLLSLQPADNQDFIRTKVMQADTEEVWTGLRFLAGDWLWVNGADMLFTDLPFCPAPGQHCGILSKRSSSSMETRDCSEGKNFLCYSYKPVV